MKVKIISCVIMFFVILSSSYGFAQERPNVIFIIVDTLRPDRLGCYGYNSQVSPHIDALSKDTILFSQAVTPVPLTTPSHASIFTALYPRRHKVFANGEKLVMRGELLAGILRENGYITAGFISVVFLDRKTNMNRGFDLFDDDIKRQRTFKSRRPEEKRPAEKDLGGKFKLNEDFKEYYSKRREIGARGPLWIGYCEREAKETMARVLKWLEQNERDPFFLWVHLYDPHLPYLPPEKYVKGQQPDRRGWLELNNAIQRLGREWLLRDYLTLRPKSKILINALYDGEITYTDEQLGRLFSYLKQKGLYQDSVIIFMSDHGEILGEKQNYYGHHQYVYEGAIKIPLMMKLPGIVPSRIDTLVRSIDVMPTLLAYLGIEDPAIRDGVNLLPFISNKHPLEPRLTFIETNFTRSRKGPDGRKTKHKRIFPTMKNAYQRIGVRTDRWKYIKHYKPEGEEEFLFDIQSDPDEETNLLESNPQQADDLRRSLEAYEKIPVISVRPRRSHRGPPKTGKERRAPKDSEYEERLQQLKSLGYM